MRSRFLLVVLALLSLCFLGAAPGARDFSGVWRLNPEQSKVMQFFPKDMRLKVEQTPEALDVTARATPFGHPEELHERYQVTGDQVSRNLSNGTTMASRTHWEGSTLVIESLADAGAQGMMHMTDRWSLAADGATLTLEAKNQLGTHPAMESVQVYNREAATAWGSDPASKPAPEIYKNIQVLKDLPANQLHPLMQTFTHSLGVGCNFCHAPGGFDQDANPKKLMARKMLLMVEQLNTGNFGGHDRVSCWTCHRGSAMPQKYPAMPTFTPQ